MAIRPPKPGGPWGFLGLRFPSSQHTLGSMLREVGYATCYVGKWHLGTQMATTDEQPQGPQNVDYTMPLRTGAKDFGFMESFLLPGSLDMYPYAFVHNQHWVGKVTARKGWSAFHRVGPAAEDFEDTQVLDTFATQAERFIDQAADNQSPFFLYLALTAPHTPVSPSASFRGRSPLGIYGDFVMETDHCVARVLKSLDEHRIADNTLVIATSDHGPAAYAGRIPQATSGQIKELEKDGHYSSGPFQGYKFSVYEGGLRVPLVARWPRVAPRGATCKQLIGLPDLMRTLADIVGAPLDEEHGVDSISFLPLLQRPDGPPTRESMLLQGAQAHAVRQGRWKLALCPGSGCPGRFGNLPKSSDAWAAARRAYGKAPKNRSELEQAPFLQLFDLQADPGEKSNLAAARPEKVAELLGIFHQTVRRGRSPGVPGPELKNDGNNPLAFNAVPAFVWK